MGTKIVYNRYIPFGKEFLAINLFGVIFTKGRLTEVDINHELIHTIQMRELLYVPFYIVYVLEWMIRIVQYRGWVKGYSHISFEKEAYENQRNMNYLKKRKHFSFVKYIL